MSSHVRRLPCRMPLEPLPSQLGEATNLDPDREEIEIIEPLCAVFRRRLKADGQKYTPERAHILNTIIELDGLFEADTLLDRVNQAGREGGPGRIPLRVSKATIYRTLKLLEDYGIIQSVLLDKDQSHYQLAYGQRPNTLLVNIENGDVEAIEIPELVEIRDRICRERGLDPQGHKFQIFARPRQG